MLICMYVLCVYLHVYVYMCCVCVRACVCVCVCCEAPGGERTSILLHICAHLPLQTSLALKRCGDSDGDSDVAILMRIVAMMAKPC